MASSSSSTASSASASASLAAAVGPSPFGRPGTVLLTTGRHRHVRLWDARASQRPVQELLLDSRDFALTSVRAHAPSLTAFVGDAAGFVSRVDLRRMQVCRAYHGAAGSVKSISLHPTLPFVAAATLDRCVRVWRADTGELVRRVYLKQRQHWVGFEGEGVLSSYLGKEAIAAAHNELDYYLRLKKRSEESGLVSEGDSSAGAETDGQHVASSAGGGSRASLTVSQVAGHATTADELWADEGKVMRRSLAEVAVDAAPATALWTTPIWVREAGKEGLAAGKELSGVVGMKYIRKAVERQAGRMGLLGKRARVQQSDMSAGPDEDGSHDDAEVAAISSFGQSASSTDG